MNIQSNKVLFSVFRAGNESNDKNHAEALKSLREQGFVPRVVAGMYKNEPERAILLEAADIEQHRRHLSSARALARHFDQESLLEVHNDGAADLHSFSGCGTTTYTERVGKFHSAAEFEARQAGSYTFDPESGQYFIVD